MPEYVVDTDELRSIATELENKSAEMSDIVTRINAQIEIGRNQKSPRIKQDIDQIEPIAKIIKDTINSMESGAKTVRTSANDIDIANQPK